MRENESHFKYGFSAGCLFSRKPIRRVSQKEKNSIFKEPVLPNWNNHHNRIQLHESHLPDQTAVWLFCRSRIFTSAYVWPCGWRDGWPFLSKPSSGLLSCLDRLSIRRNADKSRKPSQRVSNSSRNLVDGFSVSLPRPLWPAQIFPSHRAAGRRVLSPLRCVFLSPDDAVQIIVHDGVIVLQGGSSVRI